MTYISTVQNVMVFENLQLPSYCGLSQFCCRLGRNPVSESQRAKMTAWCSVVEWSSLSKRTCAGGAVQVLQVPNHDWYRWWHDGSLKQILEKGHFFTPLVQRVIDAGGGSPHSNSSRMTSWRKPRIRGTAHSCGRPMPSRGNPWYWLWKWEVRIAAQDPCSISLVSKRQTRRNLVE